MAFRLEPLLRVRKNDEDRLAREFARIQTHLSGQEDALNAMAESGSRNERELQEQYNAPMSSETLQHYHRFFQALQNRSTKQQEIISEIHSKAEAKRKDLILSMQKRRTLEILKEREHLKHQKEISKRETAFLDEVASTLWFMRSR